MASPQSSEARRFYRCAFQRFEEAGVLFRAELTTGAVYLAGYGVECILKAMLLQTAPPGRQKDILDSFRGRSAHDFGWLRENYLLNGGARFPMETTKNFMLVSDWSTDLRYSPVRIGNADAETFLNAARHILSWADGRIR